jgi:hypothetical protein
MKLIIGVIGNGEERKWMVYICEESVQIISQGITNREKGRHIFFFIIMYLLAPLKYHVVFFCACLSNKQS